MRLLANENIPLTAVTSLRAHGHDVLWASADLRGQPDAMVLARAVAEKRLLLTQDKDFGELAFRAELPSTSGVILIRLTAAGPLEVAEKILAALATREIGRSYSQWLKKQ